MRHAEPITASNYTFTVHLEPDTEAGGYVVTCPALPGLVTEGDTLQEALAMAADAIVRLPRESPEGRPAAAGG